VCAAAWLAVAGCGSPLKPDESVPLDRVPEPVMKAAREALPGFKFDAAYKIKFDGQDAYEIRGKNKQGQIREVELSTTGNVLLIE
jgi:hypothetical protein